MNRHLENVGNRSLRNGLTWFQSSESKTLQTDASFGRNVSNWLLLLEIVKCLKRSDEVLQKRSAEPTACWRPVEVLVCWVSPDVVRTDQRLAGSPEVTTDQFRPDLGFLVPQSWISSWCPHSLEMSAACFGDGRRARRELISANQLPVNMAAERSRQAGRQRRHRDGHFSKTGIKPPSASLKTTTSSSEADVSAAQDAVQTSATNKHFLFLTRTWKSKTSRYSSSSSYVRLQLGWIHVGRISDGHKQQSAEISREELDND